VSPSDNQGETARALWELIAEGSLSRAEAVRMFRLEYGVGLGYCMNMGILRYFGEAEAEAERARRVPHKEAT